jgi:pimeloyl-ACP methyl ester carboxylesterase
MSTIVLVHGAWQSAGTWDLLIPLLDRNGHRVIAPSLEGLNVGNAELTPSISLSTHIDGIARVLANSTEPVVLVGHSYAGMVISGAAEQHPEKVRAVVYIDAFIPEDGQSVLDLLPPELGIYFRNVAGEHGDGWRLPGGDGQLDLWGLPPGPAREFVRARLCDFTLRCFEEPIRLPANRKASLPAGYIACTAEHYPAKPFFAPFAAKARRSGWTVTEIDSGHDCHVEQPDLVASFLHERAAA